MKLFFLTLLSSMAGFLMALGILFLFSFCSCTYNISMAHTNGQANDVIDDTQSPQNTLTPIFKYPGAR